MSSHRAGQMRKRVAIQGLLLLSCCLALFPGTWAIKCFGAGSTAGSVVKRDYSGVKAMKLCVRYQEQCTAKSVGCTAAQQKAKAWKWTYMASTTFSTCDGLTEYASRTPPLVKDLICCNTNFCNQPPSPSKPSVAPAAPQNSVVPAPPKNPDFLKCYQVGPQMGTVMQMTFATKDGFDVCASYLFKCTESDTACTPAEKKDGAFKWNYTSTGAKTCEGLQGMAQFGVIKDLKCCTQDLCNKPDPAKDPDTKLL